jgi:flagellar biosynthesis/type III secretory pathway protein FliH
MKKGVKEGMQQGVKEGMKQGVKQGEKHLGALMQKLLADGRTEDARLAATDEEERGRLYRECGIAVK